MTEKARKPAQPHSEYLRKVREHYHKLRNGVVCRCKKPKEAGKNLCPSCVEKKNLQYHLRKKWKKTRKTVSIRECSDTSPKGCYPCFEVVFYLNDKREKRATFLYGYRRTRIQAFTEALGFAFTLFIHLQNRTPDIKEISHRQTRTLGKAIQSLQQKRNLSLWYRPHTKAA